jgi:4-hydroxyphenylacetate 3-monooxygenase
MPIRRGEEYLESLRDGRRLWLMGQRVEDNPDIGPHLHRYFIARDEGAPERFRLLKLAWEYACDSFGSRQLLFEMYNVGSLATNKQRLASTYDTSSCVALAKELAGITAA